ncbi:6-carboxytetrahydropterin synthase [Liquorilactobacillus hordei]|uniref:6-carboxytetrahydropterin synthase n=1 Tax=Liquorilactobacillus hordei TaxID=468911 RepID=UPI001CBAE45C|nr:6-carboxytetrahydropterin synthase [Liquorilactobacillus hordei]MBZ2405239.1 6-pyruvoyl tetrahydropterin synthase [Liquorilactobacillus hordei]
MSKLYKTYRIRSYVNASHAMRWENGTGEKHNHTWELICEIGINDEKMIIFNDIDKVIDGVTSYFSGKFLNDLPEFEDKNPSLENLTEILFKLFEAPLHEINASLIKLEVGESPTRFYAITSSLFFGEKQ